MKKTEAKPFKQMLLALLWRLRGDVKNMADSALNKTRSESSGDLSSMPTHMADIGSDNYEQGLTLTLMESEESVLTQVEAALERIDAGVYGLCDECDGKIPKTRLKAIPFTPYCVKCATEIQSR
jgi:DnaK suppressor protein